MDTDSSVQSLIFHRRAVVETGVQAVVVVEADVLLHGNIQFGKGLKRPAADPFGLHRVEERLHVGVVAGVPGAVHAGADAVFPEEGLVAVGPVFDAAIGVEEEFLGSGT